MSKRDRYGSKARKFKNALGSWDSKDEFLRYLFLRDLEKKGTIKNLVLKPKFDFVINGTKIGWMTPDFQYEVQGIIIEDFKGAPPSEMFLYRAKILKALYGHEISIIYGVTDMSPITASMKNGLQ